MKKYKPNENELRKYLKPFDFPFSLPDHLSNLTLPFNNEIFDEIEQLSKDKKLPQELISDCYWIVTEYLYSFRNHSKFQDISDWNFNRNKAIKDMLEFYNGAVEMNKPVLLSIKVGKESKAIDDPVGISDLMDRMKELSDRIDEEHTQKSTFSKEPLKVGIPAISNYLSAKGIEFKSSRARIIVYLYSLAEMPMKANVDSERKSLSYDSPDWDEENAMKTALNYML
jgi:hypothetical protein